MIVGLLELSNEYERNDLFNSIINIITDAGDSIMNISFQKIEYGDGREINSGAIDKIKFKDPKNPYVNEIYQKILFNIRGNAKQYDQLLIFNPDQNLNKFAILNFMCAWSCSKPILLWKDLDKGQIFEHEFMLMNSFCAKGDLDRLKRLLGAFKKGFKIRKLLVRKN